MAIRDVVYRNFSGGINARDGASEMAENEFPYSSNVTIDERGFAQSRLGYVNRFAGDIGILASQNLFEWKTRGSLVSQEGANVRVDGGAAIKTFTTTARAGFCEFGGNLCMIHPIDGFFVYDGTTVTGPIINAPKGTTCTTWQNKVWAAGDPTTGQQDRVYRSNPGTPTTWTSTDWTALREKDSSPVRLLTGASGLDITGRPGLLAFKDNSAYRINDATTGSYSTIDSAIGCGSSIGGITAYGRTWVISPFGVYSTDGLNPMRADSRLLEPLFTSGQINTSRADLYAAGRYRDRLYFSVPKIGETANSVTFEVSALEGWVVPHTIPSAAYANMNERMVFAGSNIARIYNSHQGGTDDGTAISSVLQTRWQEPNEGRKTRIRKAVFRGYGTFNADVLTDYKTGASLATIPVNLADTSAVWGVDTWGSGIWGPSSYLLEYDYWSVGIGSAYSVQISATTSTTSQGRNILGGAFIEEGAWKLSHVQLMSVDLGYI